MARVTAYMRHENIGSFAGPTKLFGVEAAQISSVAIAINGFQRTKLIQPHRQFQRADVASVPNLVATLEVFEVAVVPVGMGVTQQSNSLHRV